MVKSILKYVLFCLAVASITYNAYQAYLYYSVSHPTRMEQYAELLKDRDIFISPAGDYIVLTPEQLEACNASSGCVVVKVDESLEALENAYAAGQQLQVKGHD